MNWTAEPLVPYKFSAFLHLQQGIDKVTSIIFYGLDVCIIRSLTKMTSPKYDPNPMFRMFKIQKRRILLPNLSLYSRKYCFLSMAYPEWDNFTAYFPN